MQTPQGVGFGARCAIHADRVASRTCSRCGNFTCDECNAAGAESTCPTCRALVGHETFPFTRSAFSFDGIWNFAFEKWKSEWVMLSVCVLILFAVGFAVGLFNTVFQQIARAILGTRGGNVGVALIAGSAYLMSQLVAQLVQGIFQMGLYRVYIDVLTGRKADVARMMTQLPKVGRYIVQTLLIVVAGLVPLLLYFGLVGVIAAAASGMSLGNLEHLDRDLRPIAFVVAAAGLLPLFPLGLYFGLQFQFATMELVYGDTQPVESILRAFRLTAGFRPTVFGIAFIAFLILIVGFLACCVGLLPAMALSQMLGTSLYLALRNGSGLPPPPER